jgi:hypothetical protein
MDYTLNIGKGLGKLRLHSFPEEVEELLGEPDPIEKEYAYNDFGEHCTTVKFYYDHWGLQVHFFYFEKVLDGMHIYTDSLFYEGRNWFDLPKSTVLGMVEAIYQEKGLDYITDFQSIDYGEFIQEQYDFDAIGLTLWFEGDELDNACIFSPDDMKTH